jgi:hypothetical protein
LCNRGLYSGPSLRCARVDRALAKAGQLKSWSLRWPRGGDQFFDAVCAVTDTRYMRKFRAACAGRRTSANVDAPRRRGLDEPGGHEEP